MKSCNKGESWFLGGVLVTCMCGLMLQIMETRVLSVIGYYHLAFFAIGIAMMGMTAGALAVYYRFGHVSPTTLPHLLCRVMTGFAWSVAASLIVLLSLAIQSSFEPTLRFVASWGVTILVLLPPYVFLGMAVSLALTRSQYRVSLVYGVDLLGAALGCLVTLGLLTYTDTYTAILLVGAVGAIAAACFSASAQTAISPATGPAGVASETSGNACRCVADRWGESSPGHSWFAPARCQESRGADLRAHGGALELVLANCDGHAPELRGIHVERLSLCAQGTDRSGVVEH